MFVSSSSSICSISFLFFSFRYIMFVRNYSVKTSRGPYEFILSFIYCYRSLLAQSYFVLRLNCVWLLLVRKKIQDPCVWYFIHIVNTKKLLFGCFSFAHHLFFLFRPCPMTIILDEICLLTSQIIKCPQFALKPTKMPLFTVFICLWSKAIGRFIVHIKPVNINHCK